MIGQNSLRNFYQSVTYTHPITAALMSEHIIKVAMYGLAADKEPAKEAAERLRELALRHNLPEIQRRVLENALTDLGY